MYDLFDWEDFAVMNESNLQEMKNKCKKWAEK